MENVLIGKYFLTVNDKRELHYQGVVVGAPETGIYLCQLFSWAFGDPTDMVLAHIEDMTGWFFYADKESFEQAVARKTRK